MRVSRSATAHAMRVVARGPPSVAPCPPPPPSASPARSPCQLPCAPHAPPMRLPCAPPLRAPPACPPCAPPRQLPLRAPPARPPCAPPLPAPALQRRCVPSSASAHFHERPCFCARSRAACVSTAQQSRGTRRGAKLPRPPPRIYWRQVRDFAWGLLRPPLLRSRLLAHPVHQRSFRAVLRPRPCCRRDARRDRVRGPFVHEGVE